MNTQHESYRGSRAAKKQRKGIWLTVLLVLLTAAIVAGVWKLQENRAANEKAADRTEKANTAEKTEESEQKSQTDENGWLTGYMAGQDKEIILEDESGEAAFAIIRGTEVSYKTALDGRILVQVDGVQGYCRSSSVKANIEDTVPQQTMYVRTQMNIQDGEYHLLDYIPEKGDTVAVTGFDYLEKDGSVHMYKVEVNGYEGYFRPWYLTDDYNAAVSVYDPQGKYLIHADRGDLFGGGRGENLDYFPREKVSFEDNVMPDEVRALLMTAGDIPYVESYLEVADDCGINAFVVNISDGSKVAYPGDVMMEYSPTTYWSGYNTVEKYKEGIQKLKDAGYYVIGRITTFTDSNFVADHPECSILDETGVPKYINGSYWPSGFNRYCWEFKVAVAVEAVELFGFNEIQFDYVRFPDLTATYEEKGTIDYQNTYGETKAQAIQRFLMYACDVLHDYGVYVGADVFGECAYSYIAPYGQYWPAISNVVDVISGMPYPDHFSANGDWLPWQHPYETVLEWAECAAKRQTEIDSPAAVRTWIQCYDAIRAPYNAYGVAEVSGEIKGLREGGLTGGYMTWNGETSLSKYSSLKEAFDY